MRILLIRHAESHENTRPMWQRITIAEFQAMVHESQDIPLTIAGQQQLEQLQAIVRSIPLTHVYSSPFLRAQETARAVGQATDLPVKTIDGLHEILPTRPFVLRRNGQRSLASSYIRGFIQLLLPSNRYESAWSAGRRVRQTWVQLAQEWDHDSCVALISHRAFISTLLRQLKRSTSWQIVRRDLRNIGISEVVPADQSEAAPV